MIDFSVDRFEPNDGFTWFWTYNLHFWTVHFGTCIHALSSLCVPLVYVFAIMHAWPSKLSTIQSKIWFVDHTDSPSATWVTASSNVYFDLLSILFIVEDQHWPHSHYSTCSLFLLGSSSGHLVPLQFIYTMLAFSSGLWSLCLIYEWVRYVGAALGS